jgi:hydrogenase nickel incorporation protein HypA/HybF
MFNGRKKDVERGDPAGQYPTVLRKAHLGDFESICSMHETGIIAELIEAAEKELVRAGAGGRVLKVKLSIGRLATVSPEALQFGFELITHGTRFEGAVLEIERPPAFCHCRQCHARTETEDLFLPCPACGSLDVSIEGGQDLLLVSMETDDE